MTAYQALRDHAAVIDLSARGKIRVSGEDRARLLHAMSTNDVAGLAVNAGAYAFFLTAQGRIVADACIYNLGDALLLDTEPETGESLLAHLDKYVIADDVTLTGETALWAAIGLEGPDSLTVASKLGINTPPELYAVAPWSNGFVARVASTGRIGLRLFVPAAGKAEVLAALALPEASPDEARTVRLENGVPRFGDDMSERYLVQETQQLHAVHANKGCYLGQEIVERVRSRGQVHRLLTPIAVETPVPPQRGTKLRAAGKDVAEITSAAFSPALGKVVALAYVRTEVLAAKPEFTLMSSDGEAIAHLVN